MGILAKTAEYSQKTWNTAKAVGPFLISQVEALSERFARHQARLGEVEAFKQLLQEDVKLRADIRARIMERFPGASPDEAFRLQLELKQLDETIRIVNVIGRSLNYSEEQPTHDTGKTPLVDSSNDKTEIGDGWIDQFNELTRRRNEDWRDELLARMFAVESSTPGSISARLLWLVGVLERRSFEVLRDLLNICVWKMGGDPYLPDCPSTPALMRTVESEYGETVGNLIPQIDDLGLIADRETAVHYQPERCIDLFYEEQGYTCQVSKPFVQKGIIFTRLGTELARFHRPRWNDLGRKLFTEWKGRLATAGTLHELPLIRFKSRFHP